MAQTIVILCDECLAGGSEVPAQTWAATVTAPGAKETPYAIDACEMHAEPFTAMAKLLDEYGMRTDRKMPLPRVSRGKTAAAPDSIPGPEAVSPSPAAAPSGERACPVCGATAKTRAGVTSHVKRRHQMSMAEATGTATLPCPHPKCNRKLGTGTGISAHLRTGHGYSPEAAREMVREAADARE